MKFLIVVAVFVCFYFVGCKDAAQPAKEAAAPTELSVRPTIKELYSESGEIDSLVILYFSDKVKFRYYTFTQTVNKEDLTAFQENLVSLPVDSSTCVKDGTIYTYIDGKIYTTLYFNLPDTCRSLRLFKNGTLYNYPITASFVERLKVMETHAMKP